MTNGRLYIFLRTNFTDKSQVIQYEKTRTSKRKFDFFGAGDGVSASIATQNLPKLLNNLNSSKQSVIQYEKSRTSKRKFDFFGAGDGFRTRTIFSYHGILSPGRLPVPPLRRTNVIIHSLSCFVKCFSMKAVFNHFCLL